MPSNHLRRSLPGGGPQTSFSAWRRITFARDGRFTTDGGSGVDTDNRQGAGYTRNASVGQGTYRIHEFTMELAFDSGERQSNTFWVEAQAAGGPAAAWIGMNGRVWLRR